MKRSFFLLIMLAMLTLSIGSSPAIAASEDISTAQLMDKIGAAKGKVVLVNFFAAFCPPCRKEIPGLIQIRKDFSEKDLVIIGIGVDETKAEMESFVAKIGINYPKYYGGNDVAYSFNIEAIPFNVIYDRSGKIVFSEAGLIQDRELRSMLTRIMEIKP